MCGIITVIAKNENGLVGKEIIQQYQVQHSRGTDGFGLLEVFQDKTFNIQRATEPTKALLDAMFSKARIGVFHHRMPTSTKNELNQTHPFIISHDELAFDYGFIHNGVISNADELMKIHTEELGYVYKTYNHDTFTYGTNYTYGGYKKFNDSEALAIELARYLDGISPDVKALGSAAFVGVRIDKKSQKVLDIFWGRNDRNPLEYMETETHIMIASKIDNDEALIVDEFTIETLNYDVFLKNKNKKINDIISVDDIKFAKPEVKPITTNNVGFREQKNEQIKLPIQSTIQSNIEEDEDDAEAYNNGYKSERETAFEKMAQRIIGEVEEDILGLFYELAYDDIDDSVIPDIVKKLEDKLIEKRESANSKVRPYFDFEEAKFDANEEAINQEIAADIALSTVNERATASAERFESIYD